MMVVPLPVMLLLGTTTWVSATSYYIVKENLRGRRKGRENWNKENCGLFFLCLFLSWSFYAREKLRRKD